MNSQTTGGGQKLDTKGKDSQSMDNECVKVNTAKAKKVRIPTLETDSESMDS